MSPAPSFVTCSALSFDWPDGTPVFDGFQLSVGPGRTGLIGLNGCGKSTLLKLIAGELSPSDGQLNTAGSVGYLPQTVTLDTALRVDEALGIRAARAALHAIEAGEATEANFAAVGDDWDVEERALATLDQLGLARVGLDRTVGQLSGGEGVLLRLAALLLARPDVLLLDEPTNNLDLRARRRLYAAVESWSGVMILVSHDRELLERVDQIADLRDGEVRWYGGNFTDYEDMLAAEQESAERMVRVAEADVQRQKRELADAQVKLARRKRYGQKMFENKREPKIVMGARKRAAQESAGKHRIMHAEKLAQAKGASTRRSRRCATMPRSGSNSPPPRSRRDGAYSPCAICAWYTARRSRESGSCAVRSGSRWWAATAPARRPCSGRSRENWPRRQGSRRRTCRRGSCRSVSTYWTTTARWWRTWRASPRTPRTT